MIFVHMKESFTQYIPVFQAFMCEKYMLLKDEVKHYITGI